MKMKHQTQTFVDKFYEEYGFYPSDIMDILEDIEDYDYYEDVYSDLDGYDNNDIY